MYKKGSEYFYKKVQMLIMLSCKDVCNLIFSQLLTLCSMYMSKLIFLLLLEDNKPNIDIKVWNGFAIVLCEICLDNQLRSHLWQFCSSARCDRNENITVSYPSREWSSGRFAHHKKWDWQSTFSDRWLVLFWVELLNIFFVWTFEIEVTLSLYTTEIQNSSNSNNRIK